MRLRCSSLSSSGLCPSPQPLLISSVVTTLVSAWKPLTSLSICNLALFWIGFYEKVVETHCLYSLRSTALSHWNEVSNATTLQLSSRRVSDLVKSNGLILLLFPTWHLGGIWYGLCLDGLFLTMPFKCWSGLDGVLCWALPHCSASSPFIISPSLTCVTPYSTSFAPKLLSHFQLPSSFCHLDTPFSHVQNQTQCFLLLSQPMDKGFKIYNHFHPSISLTTVICSSSH